MAGGGPVRVATLVAGSLRGCRNHVDSWGEATKGKLRYLKHPGGPSEARPQITHRRTPLGRRARI